jgi:exodeoxyribonuclease VII large subunit
LIQANSGNIRGKTPENAITPSQLNNLARTTLENQIGSIWLNGEVTDLYLAPSGHAYFALKDPQSSIKCTFFKQYNFKKTVIKNGDSLLVFGKATLYEERGTFQLKVERVEKSGVGDMSKAFAELKVKLEALGYFNPENKKAIPPMIASLGIITSTASAAIKDVLNVIKRRNPLLQIKIYHAAVQGDKAVEEIIDALLRADIGKHDVLLLTRGGGSEEDLWTFNDVSIAQTIFNLNSVCVSAIGHERDTSISDLVADSSAITPSAAAEMLTPDISKLTASLTQQLRMLQTAIKNKMGNCQQSIDLSYHKLQKSHPLYAINNEQQNLNNKYHSLQQAMAQFIQRKGAQLSIVENNLSHQDLHLTEKQALLSELKQKLLALMSRQYQQKTSQIQSLSQSLNTLSPLSTLSRGYSITKNQDTGQLLSNSKQAKIGTSIETQLKTGKIISRVLSRH